MAIRHLLLAATAATLLVAVGCLEGGKHEHVAVENTPPAVVDGFHSEFPGLTIRHVDLITEPDGTKQYELKFYDADHHYHHKFFTPDGKLVGDKDDVAVTQPH
jgi:hypothetical protein